MAYKTEQEIFWEGKFGNEYIDRNHGEKLINSNIALFSKILKSAPDIKSIVEFGCNVGMNLQALRRINNEFELCGYEINSLAVQKARNLNIATIIEGTVIDRIADENKYDLVFTKGVLIHINPNELDKVYENIYNLSKRYVVVCEYYNPSPITINYRGNDDKLFKRDFAGELMDKYNLHLIDYGFIYHRDCYFPQDDITWFLLEK